MEKVQLFDKKSVPVSQPEVLNALRKATASCASPDGSVWIGTSEGRLVRLDVGFNLVGSPIQAFPESQPVVEIRTSNQCVVALGRLSSDDKTARLCAYHLYRSDEKHQAVFLGSARVPGELMGNCLDVTQDFAHIAVGCASGQTLIYSGSSLGKQGLKPTILSPDNAKSVVSVRFISKSILFIVTESDVTSVSIDSSDQSVSILNVDSSLGLLISSKQLVTIAPQFMASLLVAKPEAVFGFAPGEGNTLALQLVASDDTVHAIDCWRHYITLFYETRNQSVITIIATLPPSGNRVIAGSFTLPASTDLVAMIPGAFDGHSVLLITNAGNSVVVLNLREKAISEQLTALCQADLFEVAIDLANHTKQAAETQAEIFRSFGDSLFGNREYEKAISVFSRAVDLKLPLESSYVINKFLVEGSGSNKMRFIAQYLSKFTDSVQHISLLILCKEALGEMGDISSLLDGLSGPILLELMESHPKLVRFLNNMDSVSDKKRLGELLLAIQEIEKFNQLINTLSAQHLDQLISESPVIKSAVVNLAISSGNSVGSKISDPVLSSHIEYCRLGKAQNPSDFSEDPDGFLMLLLELSLRQRTNCKDLVQALIQRGKAERALETCKMFGAPASAVLPLAAAVNRPFDAIAYPAMPLDEVINTIPSQHSLRLAALAAMKRSGDTSNKDFSAFSYSESPSVALILETIDSGSSFGLIKGALLKQFQTLEEMEWDRTDRAENDQTEIQRMKSEMHLLKRKPVIHNLNDASCNFCACPFATDMSVVLFRCSHAYHEHCTAEDDRCRICAAESKHHREILTQRKSSVRNHDDLFKRMSGSTGTEKFEAAMAYLGHGLFSH